MSLELILTIVGTFGTLALGINAFFLRGIFQDLNAVKVELARYTERSEAKTQRIELLEKRLNEMERRI